jgi:hypothetical protein
MASKKWPEHYPITGMQIDEVHALLKALKKVELPVQIAAQAAVLRKQLVEHDEEQNSSASGEYRGRAKAGFHKDGEIEVDDNAVVSYGGDDGAYVMAWVWIAD